MSELITLTNILKWALTHRASCVRWRVVGVRHERVMLEMFANIRFALHLFFLFLLSKNVFEYAA